MKLKRNQILDLYAVRAHPWLMRYMAPKRHCVAATWVTVAVLKRFNIAAEPVPMKLRALNAKLVDAIARHERGEEVDWEAESRDGAWEVQIGYNTPDQLVGIPDAWNGHLVAYVPSRGVLIDASLSQVSRPHKEMVLPEIAIFAVGRKAPMPGDAYTFEGPGGVVLYYEAIDDMDWRVMRDWARGDARYRQCVNEICDELTRSK